MVARNRLRQVHVLLYKLKRLFGKKVTLREPLTNTNNVQTGVITRTYTLHVIQRAILFPTAETRTFSYDLSYIAANKNFTYGGFYEKNDRLMIVMKRRLPTGVSINTDWDILVGTANDEYEIKDVSLSENDEAYLMKVTRVQTADGT